MSFEVTGKLVAVFDTAQVTATFKKREFAIEKTDDIGGRVISNFIKFQCVQDKTEMLNRFNIGDEVKVSFNLRGNKWEKNGQTNYITNLDAWRIENAGAMQQNSGGGQQGGGKQANKSNDDDFDNLPDAPDDLPF